MVDNFAFVVSPRPPRPFIDRILENRLVLLHKTEVPDVPLAMKEFQGRLLVGVGKNLRVRNAGVGGYRVEENLAQTVGRFRSRVRAGYSLSL